MKIQKLYVYPVRSIKGIEVDSIEITPLGPLYDRNWVLVCAKTLKVVANKNTEAITFLRNEFVRDPKTKEILKLRVYFQDEMCYPEIE